MVLTRAFACALPAVASDIPGYREVLEPSASVAVPPGDPTRARRCHLRASSTDEPRRERLGEEARRIAVERYSWPGIASRLVAIYEQVTGLAQRPGKGGVTAPSA